MMNKRIVIVNCEEEPKEEPLEVFLRYDEDGDIDIVARRGNHEQIVAWMRYFGGKAKISLVGNSLVEGVK